MSAIRITKKFKFETAHALMGYDGLCKHIHGHSYELSVTVLGQPIEDESSPKLGMVMDFSELKKIVKEEIVDKMDHSLLLNEKGPKARNLQNTDIMFQKVVLVPYQPTSEMMLFDFAKRIKNKLPKNIKLHHMLLHETATSYAEWYAEDQE